MGITTSRENELGFQTGRPGIIAHVFLALTLLSSCSASDDKVKNEVRTVVSGILDADNHADIERVVSYYLDEAVLMPPGKPEIRGLDNIRHNYENIFASSELSLAPEEVEVIVKNDIAIYKGWTKGKLLAKADSTERIINDKFVMILKAQDGRWKIKTLIWN